MDSFACTQNRCGPLPFVNIFSIIEKLDLVVNLLRYVTRVYTKELTCVVSRAGPSRCGAQCKT